MGQASAAKGRPESYVQTTLNVSERPEERKHRYLPRHIQRFGPAAGILVSQLEYLTEIGESEWVWKTQQQLTQETGLTRRQQEGARKILRDAGVVEEERRGVHGKTHFRLNLNNLYAHQSHSTRFRNAPKPRNLSPTKPYKDLPPNRTKISHQTVQRSPTDPPFTPYRLQKKITVEDYSNSETFSLTANEPPDEIAAALNKLGVSKKEIPKIRKRWGDSYIQEKLDLVNTRVSNGESIGNTGGYLMRALEENYTPPSRPPIDYLGKTLSVSERRRLTDARTPRHKVINIGG